MIIFWGKLHYIHVPKSSVLKLHVLAHLPIICPLQSGGNTMDELNLYWLCLLTYQSMWCFLCRSPGHQGFMCHSAAFSLETYSSVLLNVAVGEWDVNCFALQVCFKFIVSYSNRLSWELALQYWTLPCILLIWYFSGMVHVHYL